MDNEFEFETNNLSFTTEGRSSVGWKISAKGVIQMFGKRYTDITAEEYKKLYDEVREVAERALLSWRIDTKK